MANIPQTNARLSYSAKFAIVPSDVDPTKPLTMSQLKFLGSIERFEERNPRTTAPRYEINADNPGEIMERIPTLVDRTLSIQRAIMYNADLMQSFGTTDLYDIIQQDKPFAIVKIEKAPANSGVSDKATVYTGCWLHDNPKEYNITRELKMVQTADIGYTRRFVTSLTA